MEDEAGLDEAQALLDHSSAQTTKRYAHAVCSRQTQKIKRIGAKQAESVRMTWD